MARAHYLEVAQLTDSSGFVKKVENPEVTVYQKGTTTPLVDTLYASDTGDDTELTNPFTAGSDGTVEFYLETPKRVSVKFDGASAGLGSATKIMDPGNLNTGLYSSNGEHVATISDEGVFTAPGLTSSEDSFTAVGLLESFGYYNVADHGLVTGSTSTNAAANSAALAALWTAVATAGGGVVYFPPGTYPLNATTLDHALTYSVSVSLLGAGPSSIIKPYGNGPHLNIASASNSPVARAYIRDLYLAHGDTPVSGATIRLGYVQQVEIRGVKMTADGAVAPINNLQLHASAQGISIRDCKWETQTTGSVNPISIDVANTSEVGGLYIDNSDLSGYAGRSVGIRFNNAALWDTVVLGDGVLIKDHATGIKKNSGAGWVANVTIGAAHIDGITSECVQLEPPTGSTCGTWIFDGTWLAGVPVTFANYGLLLSEGNGGTVVGIQAMNCYFSNIDTSGVSIGSGVDDVMLIGNRMPLTDITDGGSSAINVVGTSDGIVINSNRIRVAGTAFACVHIESANVDSLNLVGNSLRGGLDADGVVLSGATSASRVVASNSWKAA